MTTSHTAHTAYSARTATAPSAHGELLLDIQRLNVFFKGTRGEQQAVRDLDPVSYTHLTLPTKA